MIIAGRWPKMGIRMHSPANPANGRANGGGLFPRHRRGLMKRGYLYLRYISKGVNALYRCRLHHHFPVVNGWAKPPEKFIFALTQPFMAGI